MLLEQKVAVIYGAGGSIGGAVAYTFAREGARVFLVGRTGAKLDSLAHAIRATGGTISLGEVQQPLTDITIEDFLQPITTAMRPHFLTTFVASDQARSLTATVENISCGALID